MNFWLKLVTNSSGSIIEYWSEAFSLENDGRMFSYLELLLFFKWENIVKPFSYDGLSSWPSDCRLLSSLFISIFFSICASLWTRLLSYDSI